MSLTQEIKKSAAVQLFVARAQAVDPSFVLDADNAPPVAAICRRLDGLPLAIELAAARIPMLSPSELLSRLDPALPLLTDGPLDSPHRLRTMCQAIAWSYDLLSPAERAIFRRLSIFVGGFTLEAAEGVALSATPSVFDLVASLLNHSLLRHIAQPGAEPRFAMLETVREYGVEQLTASGEEAATREAHAAHYLTLAEVAARDAGGAGDSGWMRRLTAERPNLRAALDWLDQTGRADAALQMTGALWHYWYRLGDLAEGRTRLERALTAAPPDVDPVMQARALQGAGILARQSADYERSRERCEAALVAYRALGDQTGIAWALNPLGCLSATLSAVEQAETYMTQALAIFRGLDDAVGTANLTSNLGELAEVEGHHALAIERLEAGLAMWRTLGDRVGTVRTQVFLGQALLAQDEAARAEAVLMDALIAIRDLDYKQILPAALRAVAQLATRRGDAVAAARWYGAADGVMEALGMELLAARRAGHEHSVAAVREALGETAFAAAWDAGRAMPLEDAVTEAKGVFETDRTARRAVSSGAPSAPMTSTAGPQLTRREHEILRLLVDGRSDKEIATSLSIGRRTVSNHVATIRAKLDAPSRTAAATIAVRDGLI